MQKWIIDKVIGEFDYGHNVWKQSLDKELSCDSQCKCKWRHGHRGKVIAYVTNDGLADTEMIIDFNDLKIMTKFIDTFLDHKYLIDKRDPQCCDTFSDFWDGTSFDNACLSHKEGFQTIKDELLVDMPEWQRLKYESYVILDFVPTSENLAKWIFDIMSDKMSASGVKVHKIEWYETPKSRATYYGDV
jgi:6-pyruvoyltetrahydropterin/6-carboxytetrahydropterin synthase